jgi:hypothetical protein
MLIVSLSCLIAAWLLNRWSCQQAEKASRGGGAGTFTAATGRSEPVWISARNLPWAFPEQHRSALLNGPYGKVPIKDVLQALAEVPGGPDLQMILQVLALRKPEALPLVRDRLKTGEMWEKHMLTKFLRLCPWPETMPELLALAQNRSEQWLARQGSLYSLGALGDASAGPQITAILREPDCPAGVQLAAISALARIGCTKAASAIRPFTEHEDKHVRLFANRALAELGQPVDQPFLLSALESADYLLRQEACEALGPVPDSEVSQKLERLAATDPHEGVRDAANRALLQRGIAGRTQSGKLDFLAAALDQAERHTATWIIQTMLKECGAGGRDFVQRLCGRDDYVGERSRALLTLNGSR